MTPASLSAIRLAAMKRFCTYNGLVALGFLLLWVLLALVEVKIHVYGFLSYIFFGSLPLVFAGFFFASWRAFHERSGSRAVLGALSSAVLSPIFILSCVVAVTGFKFLIGGHL